MEMTEHRGEGPLRYTETPAHVVVVEGDLTEASDLQGLEQATQRAPVLDLAGVSRINSMGVQGWLRFMHRLRDQGVRVAFTRCSPAIVGQLNIVRSFRGSAEVRSILAPYCCQGCGREDALLVDMTDDPLAQIQATRPCADCGSEMEFDDLPEHYISFFGR
jgi:anti-anti-sigma regulatory factor